MDMPDPDDDFYQENEQGSVRGQEIGTSKSGQDGSVDGEKGENDVSDGPGFDAAVPDDDAFYENVDKCSGNNQEIEHSKSPQGGDGIDNEHSSGGVDKDGGRASDSDTLSAPSEDGNTLPNAAKLAEASAKGK
jgi:hypothetical protein